MLTQLLIHVQQFLLYSDGGCVQGKILISTQHSVPGAALITIWNAWCDAAADSDNRESHSGWYRIGYPIGTRRMTAIYRDDTQGGSWRTIDDSIWEWWSDISYDWFDVSFTTQQVY
jgi:hypothetical protein